jgi:hypothetical protein
MYVGQVDSITETRCKEGMRHLSEDQLEKSSVAEHIMDTGLDTKFGHMCKLDKPAGCMDHVVKEASEVQLHPYNLHRDGHFILNEAWLPLANIPQTD